MCWFLTVAVSPRADALLPPPTRAPDLAVRPQENAALRRAFADVARPAEEIRLRALTRNGCFCDLLRSNDADDVADLRRDNDVADLRRGNDVADPSGLPLDPEVRTLLARVAEETGDALAFVAHFYDDALDAPFPTTEGPRMTPNELRDGSVPFPADALCLVRSIPRSK